MADGTRFEIYMSLRVWEDVASNFERMHGARSPLRLASASLPRLTADAVFVRLVGLVVRGSGIDAGQKRTYKNQRLVPCCFLIEFTAGMTLDVVSRELIARHDLETSSIESRKRA